MKNIDAVEELLKCILSGLHQYSVDNRMDDTDYIGNVKIVIDAANFFLQNNKEIIDDPQLLINIIYQYSKELWMKHTYEINKDELTDAEAAAEHYEYNEYYYDYIFHHGDYPK